MVTNNGVICRIAEADESGVKAIAVTKNTAPNNLKNCSHYHMLI